MSHSNSIQGRSYIPPPKRPGSRGVRGRVVLSRTRCALMPTSANRSLVIRPHLSIIFPLLTRPTRKRMADLSQVKPFGVLGMNRHPSLWYFAAMAARGIVAPVSDDNGRTSLQVHSHIGKFKVQISVTPSSSLSLGSVTIPILANQASCRALTCLCPERGLFGPERRTPGLKMSLLRGPHLK